jgi:NAD(P)-dependent dehydrogenase (short-subunit alcohol dehydrogenase family)
MLLENRIALVTGAGTGIGQEIARLFAKQGARLVLLDRNGEANLATAHSLNTVGERAIAIQVDVRDRAGIDAAIAQTMDKWGRIDVLVRSSRYF